MNIKLTIKNLYKQGYNADEFAEKCQSIIKTHCREIYDKELPELRRRAVEEVNKSLIQQHVYKLLNDRADEIYDKIYNVITKDLI